MRTLIALAIALLGAVACDDGGGPMMPPATDVSGDAYAFPDSPASPDVWGYEDSWVGHEAGPNSGEETSLPAPTPSFEEGDPCPFFNDCPLAKGENGLWQCGTPPVFADLPEEKVPNWCQF